MHASKRDNLKSFFETKRQTGCCKQNTKEREGQENEFKKKEIKKIREEMKEE